MSNTLEIETGDVIFIMDTLKVLGSALDIEDNDFAEVVELLIESEGILNKVMEAAYEDDDVIRDVRYRVAS